MLKAAKNTIRVMIRRPHAYKFARTYKGSQIPGLVLLSAKGKVLGSVRLPAPGGADKVVELLED